MLKHLLQFQELLLVSCLSVCAAQVSARTYAEDKLVKDGWYYIRSCNQHFYDATGTYRNMYCDGDGLLNWEVADENDPEQFFVVKHLSGNHYSIYNPYTKQYVNTALGDAARLADNSSFLKMNYDLVSEQTISVATDSTFYIANTANSSPYHPLGHNNGNGTEGHVCAAGFTAPESEWTFLPADSAKYAELTNADDMHQLLKDVVDSIYARDVKYTPGTTAGRVPQEAYDSFMETFSKVLDINDKDDLEQSVYEQAVADLRQACEMINACIIHLADGWYFIRSCDQYFHSATGTYRNMYCPSGGFLNWTVANESDPKQFFFIKHLSGNHYSFYNPYTKQYVNTASGDAARLADASCYIKMSDAQTSEQTVSVATDSTFYIANTANQSPYHPLGHNNGNGTEGHVCAAGFTAPESEWTFLPADSAKYAALLDSAKQQEKADALFDELISAYSKLFGIKAPVSGLITSSTQLSSNCAWSHDNDVQLLLDGDHNTHFHSNPATSTFAMDQYLQVDLNRDDVTSFTIEYWGRNDNPNFHDNPTRFIVKATNTPDDESSWTEITTLDKGFPGNIQNAHYVSLPLTTSNAYRYYRFYVKATSSNNPYWNLSEFQLYDKVTPAAQSVYNIAEAKKIIDEIDADIAAAAEHVNNLTVDGTEMDPINEKFAQLQKIIDDQQVIKDVVAEADDLNEKLYVKGADGSYDQVASQYYRVEGMKDAADKMVAAAEAVMAKLDAGTATIADTTELKAAIAAVLALYQDTTSLNGLIAKAQLVVDNAETGDDVGLVPDAQLLTDLEDAIAEAQDNKLTNNTALLKEKTQALQDAYDKLQAAVPSIEPGKWYYILSADDAEEKSAANLYPARTVNGAALYVLNNGNGVYGALLGRYDIVGQLRWGLDDHKGIERAGDADAMWQFIAAPDSCGKRAYYIQNLRSGLYMGFVSTYLNDYYINQLAKPYPYRIDFIGAGQFNIVPLTGDRAGKAISFGDNARQVRADDITLGVSNRASFTFEEVDPDLGQLDLKFPGNTLRSYTFPFAVSGLDANENVKAYGIHSLIDETHVGLVQKNEFAVGEPMLLLIGDTTAAKTDTADIFVDMPTTDQISLKADTVNGLVGTFPVVTLDSAGLGYLSKNQLRATTGEGVQLTSYSNYIVNSLITNMEGEPDAVLSLVGEGVLNKVARVDTKADANATVNVYTIDGALVKRNVKAAKATAGLKRGIYIVGKRKVMVR